MSRLFTASVRSRPPGPPVVSGVLPNFVLLHISSSYAKVWEETKFQPRKFPQSGSKAKDGKEREKKKEKPKVGNNNSQLRIANTTSCGARKAAWANIHDNNNRKKL